MNSRSARRKNKPPLPPHACEFHQQFPRGTAVAADSAPCGTHRRSPAYDRDRPGTIRKRISAPDEKEHQERTQPETEQFLRLIFLAAGALTVKIQQCRRVFRLVAKRAERRLRCHGIRTLAVTADHAGQLDHTPRPEQHPRSPFHILMPPSLRLEQLFRQKKLPAAAPHPRRHEKAAEKLSPQYGFTSCDHTLRHTAAVGDPLHELRFPVR